MLKLAVKIYQTQFLLLCLFINIINNACQSAYERSLAEPNLKPGVLIKTKNLVESNSIEIGIQDNGLGIPQNILDKIFAPFFTTKPQGKGTEVGLYFAHDLIVTRNEGQISVDPSSEFVLHSQSFCLKILLKNNGS